MLNLSCLGGEQGAGSGPEPDTPPVPLRCEYKACLPSKWRSNYPPSHPAVIPFEMFAINKYIKRFLLDDSCILGERRPVRKEADLDREYERVSGSSSSSRSSSTSWGSPPSHPPSPPTGLLKLMSLHEKKKGKEEPPSETDSDSEEKKTEEAKAKPKERKPYAKVAGGGGSAYPRYAEREQKAKTYEETKMWHEVEKLAIMMDHAIRNLGGAVFPKLNWKAPKDSRWMALNKRLKCHNADEVLTLFKYSTIIENVIDTANRIGLGGEVVLVLIRWEEWLTPEYEFRCFVMGGKLTFISQRDTFEAYPSIQMDPAKVMMDLHSFYRENIYHMINPCLRGKYVFDAIRTPNGFVQLLDINVFGGDTTTCLTSYKELMEMYPEMEHRLKIEGHLNFGFEDPCRFGLPFFRFNLDAETGSSAAVRASQDIQCPLPLEFQTVSMLGDEPQPPPQMYYPQYPYLIQNNNGTGFFAPMPVGSMQQAYRFQHPCGYNHLYQQGFGMCLPSQVPQAPLFMDPNAFHCGGGCELDPGAAKVQSQGQEEERGSQDQKEDQGQQPPGQELHGSHEERE